VLVENGSARVHAAQLQPTGPAGKAGATKDATVALSRGPKARYNRLRCVA
jgi:hypothetical protein